MLIEFSVRNYRSIRDEQTFSFVPTALTELFETNTFESGVAGVGRLLRSAAIYGANAAGKSTVLAALLAMRMIVLRSAADGADDVDVPVTPFLFDESATKPTMFEAVFVRKGMRYQYGFECTRQRITDEWLYAYPERRAQHVFSRTYNPESESYDWELKPYLKGRKSLWRDSTGPRSLFISVAARNNSEQLAEIRKWFRDEIIDGSQADTNKTANMIDETDVVVKEAILSLFEIADLDIVDLRLEARQLNDNPVFAAVRDALPAEARKSFDEAKTYQVFTKHRTKDGGEIWLDLTDESKGTQSFFAQTGSIMQALSTGAVLVFDELNNNLHPLLARAVVSIFHSKKWNPLRAQILFTTHETALLTTDSLRRDQVWFAEKNDEGATIIYPMTDFEPRKSASLEKHYLQGRFGAIPYISEPRNSLFLPSENTDG